MDVTCTTTSLKIQNLLEMLDFLLKFLNVSVISCIHLVRLDLNHDLLCSISKFQS